MSGRAVLRTVGWLVIILYLLWFVVYMIGRQMMNDDEGFIAMTHNFAPWFGPIGIVLAIAALFSRWRWLLLLLIAPPVIIWVIWYGDRFLPPPDVSAPPGSPILRVASFNILSPESDPDEIVQAIRDMGEMDLIGLRELGEQHAEVIDRELSEQYPYRLLVTIPNAPLYMGGGLLSRYPIITHEEYYPLDYSMVHLRVEVDIEGAPITVFVVHPWTAKHLVNPFRYDETERDIEILDTLERIRATSGPILMLCDCNLPDQSESYDELNEVLDDAFAEVGWGFGFTYPAYEPYIPSLIRIDYVWYNEAFVALSAETVAEPGGSDHRPIRAELALIATP